MAKNAAALAGSKEYPALPSDGIPWSFSASDRIVAVGDIHGDLEALCHVLLDRGVIDESGGWTGGQAHLVLVGDLVGGSPHSRLLLNFLMRLAGEATQSMGRVHALLGNHDLLPVQNNFRKMTGAEKRLYKSYPVRGAQGRRIDHVFAGNSVYAEWIRSRNAIIRIGETLFVHAGLDEWAAHVEPAEVNTTVRAWIRYWQGVDERPPKKTEWAAQSEKGPLWTRAFKVRLAKGGKRPKEGISRKQLDAILESLAVRRIVIGHAPVKKGKILAAHPYYDERVVMIDTGISHGDGGALSCLEIRNGELLSHYAPKAKLSGQIVKIEMSRLRTPVKRALLDAEKLTSLLFETMEKLRDSILGLFK